MPWYRCLYVYSAGITPELVELLATEPRLVPYLDMPIQHATERMLAVMRRPERPDTIRAKVRALREAIPDLALRTTVLVGFPGETETDHRALVEFLDEIQFDRVGAFAYSAQEGTRAAALTDDVPDGVKQERLAEVLELQRAISAERLQRLVGREVEVLVDGPEDGDAATRWAARCGRRTTWTAAPTCAARAAPRRGPPCPGASSARGSPRRSTTIWWRSRGRDAQARGRRPPPARRPARRGGRWCRSGASPWCASASSWTSRAGDVSATGQFRVVGPDGDILGVVDPGVVWHVQPADGQRLTLVRPDRPEPMTVQQPVTWSPSRTHPTWW